MPILASDATWHQVISIPIQGYRIYSIFPLQSEVRCYLSLFQTQTTLSLGLPLKGVPSSKVDVFVAPDYIKVNFAPFLFEAFLAGEIVVGDDEDTESGRQLFDAGRIILQFKKLREGIWSDGPCKKNLRLFNPIPYEIVSK